MKIFITGIAGFLGSWIATEALARGWEVVGIDSMLGGDSHNVPAGVEWRQTKCQQRYNYSHLLGGVDVIYHCAAAPYEGLSVFSPEMVFDETLMSTIAVLRTAIDQGVGRFVFCSSMSRYGAQAAPFTEDLPQSPEDPYAVAKCAAENAVRLLGDLHGMEWVIAIPHNIYGPRQRYFDPFRNVAAIMTNRILQGKTPIVYGDGSQRRCLSYIDDVVDPLMKLATEPVHQQVFNLGPDDDGCTILELATMLLNITGSPLAPEFYPARPAEVHTATCSAAKARSVLAYDPKTTLEWGLEKLVAWVDKCGPRPFEYHLPIELHGKDIPRTWSEKLM